MAVAASRLALDDARLEIDGDGYGAEVAIATGNGSSETFEEHHRALLGRGAGTSSPLMVPVMIVNMPAGQVSGTLGLRGPATSVVAACASGNHGIGDAAAVIRRRGRRRDARRRERGRRHPVLHGRPRRDPRPVAAQ